MLGTVAAVVAGLTAAGFAYEMISRQRDKRYALPGRLVDVGGYRLHVTDSGQGGPAVVMIPGAGDSSYSWAYVRDEVSRFSRVISYDRAGLGSSDPGPAKDMDSIIGELHTLLQKVGVPGPYVLMGHSLGGLIARRYALRHPEQVAGMVFVDSTHESLKDDAKFRQGFTAIGAMLKLFRILSPVGFPRFLGEVLGVMPMYPERKFFAAQVGPEEHGRWTAIAYRNLTSPGAAGEVAAIFPILDESFPLVTSDQFGDMPVAVLTNPGFGENWVGMHKELASRSSNHIHQISDQVGHNLHFPRPDLVIGAIRHVLDQAADRAPRVG
jgi:pimeloyl-ACP methyl ester carboxylesterase